MTAASIRFRSLSLSLFSADVNKLDLDISDRLYVYVSVCVSLSHTHTHRFEALRSIDAVFMGIRLVLSLLVLVYLACSAAVAHVLELDLR